VSSRIAKSSRMIRACCQASRAPGGVVGVAEVGMGGGFLIAVADFAEQVDGVLVAGEGLVVVAEVVVGVAEACPSVGLPEPFVDLLEQGEGGPAGSG
jgi:hypothetical protein